MFPAEHPTLSEPLLIASDIGIKRRERWIIRHVDLTVNRGDLVCVIGANGAGKSTCVKAVLGLIELTEGTVRRAPSLKVGYVPQRLTIGHTLPLTLRRLMTLTDRLAADEVEAALAAVGLEKLDDPPVTTLSGGEFQRLLLARALIHRPDLLVLDEPAQGVDIAGAQLLDELIDSIRQDLGCGVLMISHDVKDALAKADDCVVLVPHEHDPGNPAGGSGHGGGAADDARRQGGNAQAH